MTPHRRILPPALFLLLLVTLPCAAQQGAAYEPSFGMLRDTLFLLDSTYIEVRLDQQTIYQHHRNGRVDRYACSTGDPAIPDGIATREGLFTIQWKAKKHMSQQFQVYLNYWMPFDGGIGFHGLQGRSYYRYLGRRPSSHGCVRISNETGASLFRAAPSGTVVWVHRGSPARIVRFADERSTDLVVMDTVDYDLLKRRLEAVLEGRWESPVLATRLALAPRKKLTQRVAVGRADPNAVVQRAIPLITLPFTPAGVRATAPGPVRELSHVITPFGDLEVD